MIAASRKMLYGEGGTAMKKSAFCGALVLFGFMALAVPVASAQYTDIDVATAHQHWQNGQFMLDVRTTAEFQAGHVPGAYNIDVNELAGRLNELAGMQNTDIVVYCQAGGRSATASKLLIDNAFTQIFNVLGGFDAWIAANYESVTGDTGYTNVTLTEGHQMWLDGAVVLDVRVLLNYQTSHVPGARGIPINELAARIGELAGLQNQDILVYCASTSCGWSESACRILLANGFTRVFNMIPGFKEWRNAGYDVATGDGLFALPFSCSSVAASTHSGPPPGDFAITVMTLFVLLCGPAAARRLTRSVQSVSSAV